MRVRLAPIVERLLGDPFPGAIPVVVLDEDAFVRWFNAWREDPRHRKRLEARTLLWRRLGLMQPGHSFEARKAHASGVFHRRDQRIYLSANVLRQAMGKRTVAHELVHAHRYVTGLYEKWPEGWSDTETAFRCLAEGDAELWEDAVVLAQEGLDTKTAAKEAADRYVRGLWRFGLPAPSREWYALRALLHATYVEGARFAAVLSARGGREALEAAFKDPPTSTEQILHPEKYLGTEKDPPTRFGEADLQDALGEEWTRAASGDLGELLLRILFTRALGEERGERIAAGWDGCRYHLYRKEDGPTLLALITAWDTEHDAAVFGQAWCEWAGRRERRAFDVRTEVVAAGEKRSVTTQDGLVLTVRRGRDVVVVDGLRRGDGVAVLRTLWNSPREQVLR